MREIKTTQKILDKGLELGVVVKRSLRVDGKVPYTIREILCSNCNNISQIQDQTFNRWNKQGIKFCAECHGAQKGVSKEAKIRQLNDRRPSIYTSILEIVDYLGYGDYQTNLEEKRIWCESNGIRLIVINNLNELQDIVQSL